MQVGIDAYSWLHKGGTTIFQVFYSIFGDYSRFNFLFLFCWVTAYSCSMELYLNSEGEKKLQYINYFMHRINLLKHHKITPVVVFDGGSIPCKAGTENERYRHVLSSFF